VQLAEVADHGDVEALAVGDDRERVVRQQLGAAARAVSTGGAKSLTWSTRPWGVVACWDLASSVAACTAARRSAGSAMAGARNLGPSASVRVQDQRLPAHGLCPVQRRPPAASLKP
jgi:hypothetical protein